MANSRQESINTFEKGMIKDLNPISTPNQVLTDCVNGTIITYDGNEFQLQNDKGNIALEYSKLPAGYLPVGTSSYGDILYIVAYNPITNKTQIGTFPSPQTRVSKMDKENLTNVSLLKLAGSGTIKYTDVMKNQKMQIYYGKKGDLIIYPGDQYFIENEDLPKYKDYEKLQYFILTDKKQLIDITDQVKTGPNPDDPQDHMYYVTWDIPGYLCTQWRLPQINENGFSVQPKSISLTTKKAVINCQIGSDDELIDNAYKNKTLCSSEVFDNDSLGTLFKAKDRVKYDSVNYYSVDVKCDVDTTKRFFQTTVAPEIQLNASNILLFDQFKQATVAIDLENTFNSKNTFLGNEYYNYHIDKNLATINFNINCNIVSMGEIALYIHAIKLSDFINNGYDCKSNSLNWIDLSKGSAYDGLGQNIVEFLMPEPEQIYILRFQLTDGVVEPVNFYKPLICSEFMNKFDTETYPLFTDISINQWLNELTEIEILIDNVTVGEVVKNGPYAWDDCNKADHYWTTNDPEAMTSFVLHDNIDKLKIDTHRRGYIFKVNGINVTGIYRQQYLYNFCICNYTQGSYIELLNKKIALQTGSEQSLSQFSGDLETEGYVERKYQDQNETLESGAEFEFKEACKGRPLLHIFLRKSEIDYVDVDGDNETEKVDTLGTSIVTTIIGYTNVSEETVQGSNNFDLEPEDGEDYEYYKDVDDGLRTDYHVDGRYYILRGAQVYQKSFWFKNANQSVKEILNSGKTTKAIYKYMEDYELACTPAVIELEKNTDAYALGISTNYYDNCLYRKGKTTGDHSNYIFGVFFRTYDSGAFFVPIDRFTNNGYYVSDSKQTLARNGWDLGFQEYLTIGRVKDGIAKDGTITVGEQAVLIATESWWTQYKKDTDDMAVAGIAIANAGLVTLGTVALGASTAAIIGAISGAMGVAAGSTAAELAAAAAAGAAAATGSLAVPVVGWIIGAVALVAAGITAGIAIAQTNKANNTKQIALGPFVYKPLYDALITFCNKIQVNSKYAYLTDGHFLNRTILGEDELHDKLKFDINYKTTLKSFIIKNTNVVVSNGYKFPSNNFEIFTNKTFDPDWGVSITNEKSITIASEYQLYTFNNRGLWPYKNPDKYECKSLSEIENDYTLINDLAIQQSQNWLSSIEYRYVLSGMSIGFYYKKGANALLKRFIGILHNTYNSDEIMYGKVDVAHTNIINADPAINTLETWWAFCDEKKGVYKGKLDFEDATDNSSDPRFKLFLSKDQRELSIYNLIEDDS